MQKQKCLGEFDSKFSMNIGLENQQTTTKVKTTCTPLRFQTDFEQENQKQQKKQEKRGLAER